MELLLPPERGEQLHQLLRKEEETMALREKVPREFTDDVLWYKFFTKKMLTVFVAVTFIGLLLCKLLAIVHLEVVGLLLTALADGVAMLIIKVPIPSDDLLAGSKMTIADYLIRTHICKRNRHFLYIKNYKED